MFKLKTAKAFAIPALMSLALLTGCAGKPQQFVYNDKDSYALNVAKAAGIGPVRDVELPEDFDPEKLKMLEDGKLLAQMMGDSLDAAFIGGAAMGAISMPGLGSGGTLAFGVLDWMNNTRIGPEAIEMNNIAAWMPQSMAQSPEEAVEVLHAVFKEAMAKAGEENGFRIVSADARGRHPLTRYFLIDEQRCRKDWDMVNGEPGLADSPCALYAYIYKAELVPTPHQIATHGEEMSYAVNYSVRQDRFVPILRVMHTENTGVSQAKLLADVSSYLPEWVNITIGAKRTTDANDEPVPFPYVLNQGEAKLFIKPQH